jgi:hypothetical protein
MSPQSKVTIPTIGRSTAVVVMVIALLVALGAAAIATAGASKGQSGKPKTRAEVEKALVGNWRVTSFPITNQNGDVVGDLYGDDPVGKITYTAQGDVWAFVGARDRTDPSRALWYSGAFKVRARAHEVVHLVEWSSVPGIEGTDQVRHYSLRGDRLVLSFPLGDNTAHGHFVRAR